MGRGRGDDELRRELELAVRQAWRKGWQPAEVVRELRRTLSQEHAELAVRAIAADARGYAGTVVDERWLGQLDDLGVPALAGRPGGPWGHDHLNPALGIAVRTALRFLPPLELLADVPGDPPVDGTAARFVRRGSGRGGRAGAPPVDSDERMLERIRALLAKAESTTFAEEAEAFTVKAQELMARYSIDHALLDAARAGGAGAGADDGPAMRRLAVDDPYASPKAMLLGAIATANGCRSVWRKELGLSSVVGHEPDLDVVELLYTSLLVQADVALAEVARHGREARTRSFRQSFLVSFAARIGERLRETAASATVAAEEERGVSLVPVLARRTEAVEATFVAAFPRQRKASISANDVLGRVAGRDAADRADLRRGPGVEPRRAALPPRPGTGVAS